MYTVRVDAPDPAFGNMLLEQCGGANGELAAAMQYSIQGLNCDDLVDRFFNDSSGAGDDGEIDARGAWNQGGQWQFVDAPAFQDLRDRADETAAIDDRSTTTAAAPAIVADVLVDELQDLLHAEGRLVKALPRMAKAANSDLLRLAFEKHLDETRGQVDRLKEVFELLDVTVKPTPCTGMAGLLAEGDEMIQLERISQIQQQVDAIQKALKQVLENV